MNNTKYIYSSLLILIILSVVILFYKNNQIKKENYLKNYKRLESGVSKDFVVEANKIPGVLEAKKALLDGKYDEAYALYKKAANSTEDLGVRSSLEISAASSFMSIDTGKGAEYYMDIVNNKNYPNISRGYALLQIAQFYKGNRDLSILKAYFKDDSFKDFSVEDLEYKIYSDIYDIYPYGIAAARKGIYEIKKDPSTSNAKKLYEMYTKPIQENIEYMQAFVGMRSLVGNTYLAKANFYRELLKYKASNKEEVSTAYEDANRQASIGGETITRQFNMLRYADFLIEVNEIEKSVEVINSLSQESISNMVKINFSKTDSAKLDYFNLAKVYASNNTMKSFFSQFGW